MTDQVPRGRTPEQLKAQQHEYVHNRGDKMDGKGTRCLKCGTPEQDPIHWVKGIPEQIKAKLVENIQQQGIQPPKQDWLGDNPFWLMFQPIDGERVGIDLDEGGWIEQNKANMRAAGTWYLVSKRQNRPLFTVVVEEGDQFYYAKRHVGVIASTAVETVCYGIGKKKADGTPVNLWLLPNGTICGGDDVDPVAIRLLKGS